MCDLCRPDGNHFHTSECVYDQLVQEYPVTGWLIRMRYNDATDVKIDPQHGDVVGLPARSDAFLVFMSFREDAASALPAITSAS